MPHRTATVRSSDATSGATTATETAAAVEAVRSVARVARILERASGELGLAHYRVLSAIAAGEERASRVAARFELGRPTVSASVDALCRAGLIERAAVENDQRAFALRLTAHGQETLQRVETEMVAVLEELCRHSAPVGSTTGPDDPPVPEDPTQTGSPVDLLAALGKALDARAERNAPSGRRSPTTTTRPASPSSPS